MSFEHRDSLLRDLLSNKQQAERSYEQQAQPTPPLPAWLQGDPGDDLLQPDWAAITIRFTLQTPWYSRDDVPFHVLHNPVRRDRVLGRPFVAASSWKGLLRWACRMERGLYEHLEKRGDRFDGWADPPEILHLFGSQLRDGDEGGLDRKSLRHGALAFRPTWFEKSDSGGLIDFELINPHDRKTKKGTTPITYEVVAAGARGRLDILYAPPPGQAARDGVSPPHALALLLEACRALIERYGFSAKRTAGWGRARIDGGVQVLRRSREPLQGELQDVIQRLPAWWEGRGT